MPWRHAKTLPDVDTARIGLLGFSLGGHLCLRNRALAKVLVEFFAPELPELGGLGAVGSSTLHAQMHHGDEDQLVPLKLNAVPIEQQLRAEGADVTLFPYQEQGHGFSGKHAGDVHCSDKFKRTHDGIFCKLSLAAVAEGWLRPIDATANPNGGQDFKPTGRRQLSLLLPPAQLPGHAKLPGDDVRFSDFAFDIRGKKVMAMWHWFCVKYPPREQPMLFQSLMSSTQVGIPVLAKYASAIVPVKIRGGSGLFHQDPFHAQERHDCRATRRIL